MSHRSSTHETGGSQVPRRFKDHLPVSDAGGITIVQTPMKATAITIPTVKRRASDLQLIIETKQPNCVRCRRRNTLLLTPCKLLKLCCSLWIRESHRPPWRVHRKHETLGLAILWSTYRHSLDRGVARDVLRKKRRERSIELHPCPGSQLSGPSDPNHSSNALHITLTVSSRWSPLQPNHHLDYQACLDTFLPFSLNGEQRWSKRKENCVRAVQFIVLSNCHSAKPRT